MVNQVKAQMVMGVRRAMMKLRNRARNKDERMLRRIIWKRNKTGVKCRIECDSMVIHLIWYDR